MAQPALNVTALTSAAKTRLEERARTASEIEVLASESRSFDPAIGTLLTRLADAVRRGDRDEIHGYADAVDPRASKPFLLLWEQGFGGAPGVLTFSTVAIIDASLISLLIVLSLIIHVRADVRDVATRTRALLKESEIRGLLGHATSLATSELPDTEADAILDEMAAEERRIYERAMEREQQLFNMESAVGELREAAQTLARAAESMGRREEAKR